MTYYKIGHTTVSFYLLKIAEKQNCWKKKFQSIFTLRKSVCIWKLFFFHLILVQIYEKQQKKIKNTWGLCFFHFSFYNQFSNNFTHN